MQVGSVSNVSFRANLIQQAIENGVGNPIVQKPAEQPVKKDDFAKEIAATAKAFSLWKFFGFLHAAQPKQFVIVGFESFKENLLLNGNALWCKGEMANDFVSVGILERKGESRVPFDANKIRRIFRHGEHLFGKIYPVHFQR